MIINILNIPSFRYANEHILYTQKNYINNIAADV